MQKWSEKRLKTSQELLQGWTRWHFILRIYLPGFTLAGKNGRIDIPSKLKIFSCRWKSYKRIITNLQSVTTILRIFFPIIFFLSFWQFFVNYQAFLDNLSLSYFSLIDHPACLSHGYTLVACEYDLHQFHFLEDDTFLGPLRVQSMHWLYCKRS